MSIKNRILSLLLAGLLVGGLSFAAYGLEDTTYPSYAGEVKILNLEDRPNTMRTTEVVLDDLMLSEPSVNIRSYRFADLYTEYWDGEETVILEWTDANYLYPGDTVLTLESSSDPILLKEKELAYQRKTEEYQKQCSLYEQQICNQREIADALQGTEQEIALLELQKRKLAYEAYRYRFETEMDPLKEQINTLSQQKESIQITADREGYLYVPNRRLTVSEHPTVENGEALYSIVTSRDCVYYAEGEYAVGTSDTTGSVCALSNVATRSKFGVADGVTDTAFFVGDVLTDEILQKLCGFGNASTAKWRPSMQIKMPITEQALLVPISMVYLESGQALTEAMSQQAGRIDEQGRYYVLVYQDGIAHPRYVLLGQHADNRIVILSGLSGGELLVSQ